MDVEGGHAFAGETPDLGATGARTFQLSYGVTARWVSDPTEPIATSLHSRQFEAGKITVLRSVSALRSDQFEVATSLDRVSTESSASTFPVPS